MMSMAELNSQEILLPKVRELASKVNERCSNKGLRTVDPKSGQQLNEYWIPHELMILMLKEAELAEHEKSGIALVKYYQPNGDKTWYVSEILDEGHTFYGLYTDSRCKEYGYFSVKELRETYCDMGLWIERDYHFEPTPLKELKK